MVRSWSRRYLLVLGIVAALVVIDQAIIQPMLVGLSVYAPKINLAGRQRMLSQKVVKEGLALSIMPEGAAREERRAQLRSSARQWIAAHRELSGDDAAASHEAEPIATTLHELDEPMAALLTAAEALAANKMADDERSGQLHIMLDQESKFLAGMEQVVTMLEQAAQRDVYGLRASGLAVMAIILLLLGGVYFTVLRPAAALIDDQLGELAVREHQQRLLSASLARARGELELRVAQRTSELSTANDALMRQIAERQADQKRMRELAGQLAHASRVTALGQLATGLAHEINQPLASIVSYSDTVELLMEQPANDLAPMSTAISQIKQAALRAGAIVRRMRNFVRRGTPQRTRVDLHDLVREVCNLCRPQLEQSGVQLLLDKAPDPLWVDVDAIEIQQVLVNVVQNAIQALADCPRNIRQLRIRTSQEDTEARAEIVDSGPGFTTQDLERSLIAFYSTKADGLGMGLAISRAILDRHQGRFWVENCPQGGAQVVFCLPLTSVYDLESGLHADSLCH
jgi:C4-dicarboxylate-specific signal transduction histidine kinase